MDATSTAVTLPATPDSVRILRLMAADAAASADLSFDRYNDLELAIAEAAKLLLDLGPARLRCVLDVGERAVRLELCCLDPSGEATPDELAMLVLGAVVDDLASDLAAPAPTISLTVGAP